MLVLLLVLLLVLVMACDTFFDCGELSYFCFILANFFVLHCIATLPITGGLVSSYYAMLLLRAYTIGTFPKNVR